MQSSEKSISEKRDAIDEEINKQLKRIVDENSQCDEIKVQLVDNKIQRFVATETIPVDNNSNIEKICRQYSNQDILVKIRNGKKIVIERTKIIKP